MALDLVQYGQSMATFCVNFDGAARVEESGGALAYIDPPGATALTPDLVSALTTAAEPELAEAFITFVLSPQGQELWVLEQQARVSPGATLYHYPIDPQLYTDERYEGKLSVTRNPFETDFGLQVEPAALRATGQLVELLVSAAAPAHVKLQQAWERIIAADTPAAAVDKLGALPAEPEALRAVVMPAVKAGDDEVPDNPTAAWLERLPANWQAAAEAAGG
jgi:ABC-type glycerol-3-phosphate transport system substrate-binding protein